MWSSRGPGTRWSAWSRWSRSNHRGCWVRWRGGFGCPRTSTPPSLPRCLTPSRAGDAVPFGHACHALVAHQPLAPASGRQDRTGGARECHLLQRRQYRDIAIKRALDRPDFDLEPDLIRSTALETGFDELDVSGLHAVRVRHLPQLHRGPFDRLLRCPSPGRASNPDDRRSPGWSVRCEGAEASPGRSGLPWARVKTWPGAHYLMMLRCLPLTTLGH
jgi:hypothetical protein